MAKMGRPKIEWNESDWKRFEGLCAIHCTAVEVRQVMGCSEETINRLCKEKFGQTFEEYVKNNSVPGKISLRRKQWESAMAGNTAMQIWLGKQWLGQRDKVESEVKVSNIDDESVMNGLKELREFAQGRSEADTK